MERYERLLALSGQPMLITSDENVFYFSGFTGGDSFLLIADGFLGLFTDTRYTLQAKREAPGFEIFDTDAVGSLKSAVKRLGITHVGIEEEHMTIALMARFTDFLKFVPAGKIIRELRMIKDKAELEKIRLSQKLSEAAFMHFVNNAHVGMTELSAACLIEGYMRENGAKKTSFDTIVASGPFGAMPHAVAQNREIKAGTLAVCDFGCVLDGYMSDMTRTVAFGQIFDYEREVYEVVKKAQCAAEDAVCEGVTGACVDRAARNVIENAGYGEYFTHSTGHGVGLQIHEGPSAARSSDTVLKEGMTLTVEPGIYIPERFGVRIENLTVVQKNGCEVLNSVTKELITV